jgi:TatA/E family protein of Tat protein translocase
MPTPGPLELVIILVIALIILGPGKLPDVGASLGKSIREFRKASSDIQEAATVKVETTPLPPQPAVEQAPAAQPPVATAAPYVQPAPADVPAPAAPVAAAPAAPVAATPAAPIAAAPVAAGTASRDSGTEASS